MFKKAACFTDIHFGLKNNSRQHNNDCENFVNWFIDEAKNLVQKPASFWATGIIIGHLST